MARINPYIHFNGNAEEAFTFYRSVFGGEFSEVMRYKDLAGTEFPIPENDADRLMHIALPVGDADLLLGSDVMEMMGKVTENDNRNTIAISTASRGEADHLFNGLSSGGNVEMPMSEGPSGAYFGMFTDRYGVQWMVDFDSKKEI